MATNDLRVLMATFRSHGGKISTNVVDGHNVTTPDGRETRLTGSRVPDSSARRRLIQILTNELAALDGHQRKLEAARRVSEYELGDPSWADRIIQAYLDA